MIVQQRSDPRNEREKALDERENKLKIREERETTAADANKKLLGQIELNKEEVKNKIETMRRLLLKYNGGDGDEKDNNGIKNSAISH